MNKSYLPKLVAIVLMFTIVSQACGTTSTSAPTNYDQALPLFDYDSSAPFETEIISEEEEDGVVIQEISFIAADPDYTDRMGGRIVAYLVRPSQNGSHAGILFQHGYGPGWGNKRQFLEEAVELAHQGVVSLLPAGLFPWMIQHSGDGEVDQMKVIGQVIELRRSLDFLLSQPEIDPQRIAYVGHDYGAMHGAVLSGVDERIKAYVLMAGDETYTNWAIDYFLVPEDDESYRALMTAVDPITYLPHASPAELYFQFGGLDGFVLEDAVDRSFLAASEPKKLGLYDSAGHILNKQAGEDRLAWLVAALDLNADH
jgi:dienelactone hydrolase